MIRTALFSPCKVYRYRLLRVWNLGKPRCCFCMLNPSTADEFKEDPTVAKCVGYADRWGYGSLEVVNAFALRSTDPAGLLRVHHARGPDNNAHIIAAARSSQVVIVAWGVNMVGQFTWREDELNNLLSEFRPYCLKLTKGGHPQHPLYCPKDLQPIKYRWELN